MRVGVYDLGAGVPDLKHMPREERTDGVLDEVLRRMREVEEPLNLDEPL